MPSYGLNYFWQKELCLFVILSRIVIHKYLNFLVNEDKEINIYVLVNQVVFVCWNEHYDSNFVSSIGFLNAII